MTSSPPEVQHCYSARLMRPFARALRTYPHVPEEVAASIEAIDPDERLPISTVHELLAGAVVLSDDQDIGLRAAGLIGIGDYGALEYAASTATTGREALETIGRYMHLINDALTVKVREEDGRAVIVLDNALVMPRAAEGFELGAFYSAFRNRNSLLEQIRYEVNFVHAQPDDLSAYVAVFSERATLRFSQTWSGFVFPLALLQDRLPTADPVLHALVRRVADRLLADLPVANTFTARVRELVAVGLANGRSGAAQVADALHMSPRTLARRLAQEGASFKVLSEEVRRSLAMQYVGQTELAFSEIAFLLGFSQASAFHRAFRRWLQRTPLEYRTEHRA